MRYRRSYHSHVSSSTKPPRRPRGSLSRDQVVEAALTLADQEGIEAVTMQNLAGRLACGVMTLYGYVDSKEDLLDAIAQRGLSDLRLARPLSYEPEAILVAWGRALRRTLIEHPSLPMIFLSRPVIGPGIFRGLEALLGALGRAGVQAEFGASAVYAVLIYTTGFVAWEIPRSRQPGEYAATWRREFAGLPPADFPLAGRVLDELALVASEQQFELGLTALAEGLASRYSS